jgi:lipid-A-disaccharide synthase
MSMKLAVVAGEASGDLHASEVIRELKNLSPDLQLFGIGGELLQRQGMELIYHARELGIVGLFNVVRHLAMFRRVFQTFVARIEAERPDAVLLVDFPEFNLRVARRAKELGVRVIYFISPQIWAWRRGRVRQIEKTVDQMIVIFPFERDFYEKHDVPVTYVGHPLIDHTAAVRRTPPKPGVLRVALMPGSRKGEVDDLLPPMLEAVEVLRRERAVEAFIIQAPTIDEAHLAAIVKARRSNVPIVPRNRGEALASADVAVSSSGTATLESAILGTPVVVLYKLTAATYLLARRLVRLPHFSLVNIVAGREVVPELLQHDVTGDKIAAAVLGLVAPERSPRVKADLDDVKHRLGERGASRRAAEAIMAALQR